MGLTRLKFGKQQNCDSIRSMTISGVTVTGVDCIRIKMPILFIRMSFIIARYSDERQ